MSLEQQSSSMQYPPEWNEHKPALTGTFHFDVAGFSNALDINLRQLDGVFFPLLSLLNAQATPDERVIAGLAGIPGSGKSTFAAATAFIADRVLGPGRFVTVGMDGWHWPNAILEQRTIIDENGKVVPLHRHKGGPESFDIAAMSTAIRQLGQSARNVMLPRYDRRTHEPVADAVRVPETARIILFEGNYLLNNEAPWNDVSSRLRPKLFLECDPATAKDRVLARHVRGGLTADQAMAKFSANDRRNTRTVLATRHCADWMIRLDPPDLRPVLLETAT